MREIKFISHLTRNLYLFFWVYLILVLLFHYDITPYLFFLGLAAYVIGYAPVYFFNDFQDWKEDLEDKKSNLYLSIKHKGIFVTLAVLLLICGAYMGLLISATGYSLLLIAYLLNIFYSYRPFSFRKRTVIGSINYFVLSIIKFNLILLYLHFPHPLTLFFLAVVFACFGSASLLIYKRHKQKNITMEKIFEGGFIVSAIIVSISYPLLLTLFVPLIIILGVLHIRYRSTQIPLNIVQIIFFVYTVLLFLFLQKM